MQKSTRFNLIFVTVSAGLFILGCVATSQLMIRLIVTYLNDCRAAAMTASCSATSWFVSYWWVFFIAAVLLAALLAHRVYLRLRGPNITEADYRLPR
jgi:H+/Cl- antiporter ClcA